MAANNEEYPPKKESAHKPFPSEKAVSSSSNYSPPGYVGYPPHNMGYPPPTGYPPNYPSHHPNAYPPPPVTYYFDRPPSNTSNSREFFTGFIICSLLILFTFCLASYVAWFMTLLPKTLSFRVEKLSVSNFSTSRSVFVIHFDINLSIENGNHDLKAYFEDFRQAMYHDNDIVSVSSSLPVALDTKERRVVNITMSTDTSTDALEGRWVVDALEKERASGSVTFILKLKMAAAFKYGTMWTETAELRVLCDDLKVQFTGDSGNGALDTSDGNPRKCIVSIGRDRQNL